MSFADRDKYGMYKNYDDKGPGPALMGASTLLGEDVVNNQEDDLGDIKEIMLDMRNGEVAYAVLAFGGFLGLGEKLFAVPWQALQLDTVNKRFVLNVDKERLKSAPGFDPDNWPDMSDVNWAAQIHAFYGTDPRRSGSMGTNIPMDGMVGGASRGAGASSMGAGAGSMGAGHAGSSSDAGTSGTSGLSGTSGAGSSGSSGAGSSGLPDTSGSSGAGAGPMSGASDIDRGDR
jgi:sporulation protein YlmC with PRC-barrel domain